MKIIFLDIDGVLNNHKYDKLSHSSTIDKRLVSKLNRITDSTSSSIVISSAWRYMILGKDMTIKGFEYLLRTYGVHAPVIGHILEDEHCTFCNFKNRSGILKCEQCQNISTRGNLIKKWRDDNLHCDNYLVIDDLDLDISEKHPFVQTDSNKGLTERDVKKCIKFLLK